MQKFKFREGTKVKHKDLKGAGKVLEQVDSSLTAVRWYDKERGFFKTLFNTKDLSKID